MTTEIEALHTRMVEASKMNEDDQEVSHADADDVLVEFVKLLASRADEEDMQAIQSSLRLYQGMGKWYA